jgi:hypothetical protein
MSLSMICTGGFDQQDIPAAGGATLRLHTLCKTFFSLFLFLFFLCYALFIVDSTEMLRQDGGHILGQYD